MNLFQRLVNKRHLLLQLFYLRFNRVMSHLLPNISINSRIVGNVIGIKKRISTFKVLNCYAQLLIPLKKLCLKFLQLYF